VLDVVQRILKIHQERNLLRQKVQQILQDEQALSGMSPQDILMLKGILWDLLPGNENQPFLCVLVLIFVEHLVA